MKPDALCVKIKTHALHVKKQKTKPHMCKVHVIIHIWQWIQGMFFMLQVTLYFPDSSFYDSSELNPDPGRMALGLEVWERSRAAEASRVPQTERWLMGNWISVRASPVFIAHPVLNVEPSEQVADVNTCVHKFHL